jgi:alpha-L-arabinofuranosidase
MSKLWSNGGCVILAMALAASGGAQSITATIHTDSKPAAPISKLIFGGFMEPATTRVWAEMLSDRKFLNEINSKPQPAPAAGGFGRRGAQARWAPIGADEFVTMGTAKPYVGDWSPLIRLEANAPHGIREAGLQLRAGRAYTGRVVLAGNPGAKVDVSLIWGPEPGDRQTVTVRLRTAAYAKYPVSFTSRADTAQGAFEIAATGSGSFHIGATSLMPADNVSGFRADMIHMLKEQGIEIARWPGGNFVSAYDWRDGIGDSDKRPPRRELARHSLESNDMGIDDFMTFCRLTGAEPYIAIDSGRGDDHSAAEEVEYVNGATTSRLGAMRVANGHPTPYGVKIWGIGNEMYGPWQWGYMPNNYYAEKHNLIVQAMRKVDPSIKVIASGAMPEEMSWTYIENRQFATFSGRETVSDKVPYVVGSKYDWSGGLLEHSADYTDYLAEHFYGYPNWYVDEATQQFVPSDELLADKTRRMSNRVELKFEVWDEYVKRMPYLKDKDIKFAFDEWSPRNRPAPAGATAPAPDNPMLNSLTEALVYHEFFRHSDKVGLAIATGGMGMMANDAHGEAIGLRTDGLVMKLLHDHFAGAIPVGVSGDSPQHDVKGTVAVDKGARPSGSPTYPLDVFAALSADRKKLEVSVVNPTETAQDCNLKMEGIQTAGAVKIWRITAPAGSAPAPARGGLVSAPPATMSEITLQQALGSVNVPPASISVYEFEVKP